MMGVRMMVSFVRWWFAPRTLSTQRANHPRRETPRAPRSSLRAPQLPDTRTRTSVREAADTCPREAGSALSLRAAFQHDTEPLHAPVKRLSREAHLGGRLRHDAAGLHQRVLDAVPLGIVGGRRRDAGGGIVRPLGQRSWPLRDVGSRPAGNSEAEM